MLGFAAVVAALLACTPGALAFSGPTACGDFSQIAAGQRCTATWGETKPFVHPTQNSLGYAWLQYKVAKYFGDPGSAQAELDAKIVPVCKGPEAGAWLLDHHHMLGALDYAGFYECKPTFQVVCDFSGAASMDAFWASMAGEDGVYAFSRPRGEPNALPTAIPPGDIPATLSINATGASLVDNPWRALAGFSRKLPDTDGQCDKVLSGIAADDGSNRNHNSAHNANANASLATGRLLGPWASPPPLPPSLGKGNKYCMRAYDKVCDAHGDGIPFFEFRWSYFFNDAYNNPKKLWPSKKKAKAFAALYDALPSPMATDAWFEAAAALFPLARSKDAGKYRVPKEMGTLAGPLPGYEKGDGPIPESDPDCNPPSCKVR